MREFVLLSLFTMLFRVSDAQTWETLRLNTNQHALEQEIAFLQHPPTIDGVLDAELGSLTIRQFAFASRYSSDSLIQANYRLAYGAGFFYVYVEAKAKNLIFRDRAYQNGDGFVMVLSKASAHGEPADEFYELACSAVNKPSLEWTRRFFWNYNVSRLFVPTSDDAKLEFREDRGTISFELLLPWSDVRPYHPWLAQAIGFNLTFTKAIDPDRRMIFRVIDDPNVGAEFKTRHYQVLKFGRPEPDRPQTFVTFPFGHLVEGDSVRGVALTATTSLFRENLTIRLESAEGSVLARSQLKYDCSPGLTRREFAFVAPGALEGGYVVKWNSDRQDQRGHAGLSILEKFDQASLLRRLEKNRDFLSAASLSSAQFFVQELSSKISALKPYETGMNERLALKGLLRMIAVAERGIDPFAGKTGFLRQAYRSRIDSTLQPYVVFVPDNLVKGKKYPLLVYLHGSASDETNIQSNQRMIPPGFFALGPFGRGASNGFARDHAQDDIAEAIAAVEQEYPIDTTRILLSGFSMGGYGAYRTVYETRSKFRALAVFSGGPSLGRRYAPDANPPDFLNDRNLIPFRGLPIFIFHGERDMNLGIEETKELVGKLKKVGAHVETRFESEKGHETPSPEGIEMFKNWALRVLDVKE